MSPVPDRSASPPEPGPDGGKAGPGVVQAVGGWLQAWGRQGIEFLYPPACRLCACELPPQSSADRGSGFCLSCETQLLADGSPGCGRCGAPVGMHAQTSAGCPHCRGDRFAFDTVIRLGVYQGVLKTAILDSKRRGAEGLVLGLAELVWRKNAELLRQLAPQMVLPVPHHGWQALFRPHNPAGVLAEAWGERLCCPVQPGALVKTRWTRSQARLGPAQRRSNLKGVFKARPGVIAPGATVLLADDVLTTGSTAHEAALALRKAGAGRVIVAVVARGLGQPR